MAIGFTYIFRVARVFHLAHGGIYVAGAFASWWLFSKTGSWIGSAIFALLIVSVLFLIFEKTVYLPLNKKQSNQSISLIASMGLYVLIVNALAMIFGNETKVFGAAPVGSFQFGEIIITKIQVLQFCIGLLLIFFFIAYLKISKSKLSLQSMSDNETISKVFGINTEKERVKVFLLGSMLACAAAILKSIEIGIDPQIGMSITLTAAVVTILSSRLNVSLIVVFSIALTLLQNSVEWFCNAQWRDGLTFLLLLLVILYRTEGIISYNLRKDRA